MKKKSFKTFMHIGEMHYALSKCIQNALMVREYFLI